MRTSWSDRSEYREVVELFATDDAAFATFRRTSPAFHTVLEHCQYDEALACTNEILLSKLWQGKMAIAAENDLVGAPNTNHFPYIGTLSNSTVRYMLIASRVYTVLRGETSVVEVGGGYGGLAALLIKAAGVTDYTIYDLPECGALQRRYLAAVAAKEGTYQTACTCDAEPMAKPTGCFVSTWAFNELMKDEANKYRDTIRLAKHGYVVGHWVGNDSLNEQEWMAMAPAHATHRLYEPDTGFRCVETRW